MRSRFSIPTPCSPVRHPTGARTLEDLVAGLPARFGLGRIVGMYRTSGAGCRTGVEDVGYPQMCLSQMCEMATSTSPSFPSGITPSMQSSSRESGPMARMPPCAPCRGGTLSRRLTDRAPWLRTGLAMPRSGQQVRSRHSDPSTSMLISSASKSRASPRPWRRLHRGSAACR